MKSKKELKFASSDIEANNWIEFNIIGIYYKENNIEYYLSFDDIDDYLKFVTKNLIGYRIYFHNGGRYDFLFLFEKLMQYGTLTIINKDSGLIALILNLNNKRGKIEFVDSFLLLPSSLEKLSKIYNTSVKKYEVDFNKNFSCSDSDIQLHLKNDCIILYEIIEQVYKIDGILKYTIASQSLTIFKERFFNGYFWNAPSKFDNLIRNYFYYGGRVEVYKTFGKNLYYYDINSLYPFVMLQKMPIGSPKKTKKFIKNKIGFYKIKFLQKYESYISPLIYRTTNGNYFVNANFNDEFYVTNLELEYFLNKKIKIEIVWGYYFEKSDFLFNDYVLHYYKIKSETKNETERFLAKLKLNSLYGKFGQKTIGNNIEEINENNFDSPIYSEELGLVLVEKNRNVTFRGVYIAAYITALARFTHFQLMEKIGFENIYYCDTDSIVTSKKLSKDFITNEIGKLKLESKIKEGVFLLPKTYAYIDDNNKEVVKCKGMKNLTYLELKNLLFTEKNYIEKTFEKILGFKESLKRKNKIKKSAGTLLKLVDITKKLEFNYKRRKLIKEKKFIYNSQNFYINEINELNKKNK